MAVTFPLNSIGTCESRHVARQRPPNRLVAARCLSVRHDYRDTPIRGDRFHGRRPDPEQACGQRRSRRHRERDDRSDEWRAEAPQSNVERHGPQRFHLAWCHGCGSAGAERQLRRPALRQRRLQPQPDGNEFLTRAKIECCETVRANRVDPSSSRPHQHCTSRRGEAAFGERARSADQPAWQWPCRRREDREGQLVEAPIWVSFGKGFRFSARNADTPCVIESRTGTIAAVALEPVRRSSD